MSRYRLSFLGLLAVLLGLAGAWSYAAKPPSIEQRLQRMEDIEAIRELLVAYGRNFDKRDFTAYANLFAKDGVWVGGAGGVQSYQGPDAIRAMAEKGYPPSVFPGAYHIMSNFAIELTGPDSAQAWSRWTFVVNGVHKEPVIFRGGYYEDTFVREDGRWKFKRRVVATDPTSTGQ
ncbi:MAG TPA: nuclear transport factor 2 family protein [Steroidobacteraceae bacterium]|jgi:uncharacterized protein (TIGR02246 family)|nr:nuclear transport factor 2 family protein [Steroidobacteraceae bacterium]